MRRKPIYKINWVVLWGRDTDQFHSGTFRILGIDYRKGVGYLYHGIGVGGEQVYGVREHEIMGVS